MAYVSYSFKMIYYVFTKPIILTLKHIVNIQTHCPIQSSSSHQLDIMPGPRTHLLISQTRGDVPHPNLVEHTLETKPSLV